MNSKLFKASLAGVAAIAVTAGGTTFAAWSDFTTDNGNTVGADTLALDVDESQSVRFDDVKLAPGVGRDLAFYVASRDGVTVPDADLTMTIKNLVGEEDGCSSNSEATAEKGSETTASDPGAPCATTTGNEGQFIHQALYYVQARKTDDPSTCSTSALDSRQLNKKLSLMEDVPVNLLAPTDVLSGGDGVCVLAHVFMPNNQSQYGLVADDKSQGDSATFDIRFDLTQVS